MKNIAFTAAIAIMTIGGLQAQEKVEKTTTTRTTVKSSLGDETVYKTVKETAVTPTYLDPSDEGQTNQSLETGYTIIKREVTYTYNDSDFMLKESDYGYTIMRTRDNNTSQYGTMRKLSKGDVYLTKTMDGISVNYFDDEGNMVSEKYNDKDDTVTTITYKTKKSKNSPKMKEK